MAIIKKPIHKTLILLISLAGVLSILISRLFIWNSNANLAQLENKAKKIFIASSNILIPTAKADIPNTGGDNSGEAGAGGDCDGMGDSCGDSAGY